jgi:L-threonylcarbamoyladenylate synthase
MILDAGPTTMGVESTVLDVTQSPPAILRPGGVTREELEAVIGPVGIAASVADEAAKSGLAGPGMTHTHYAPVARVELFEGEMNAIIDQMAARALELRNRGRRVGAIVSEEMLPMLDKTTDMVSCFGKWGQWEKLAHRLFAAFRVLDTHGMVVILCVVPPGEGIGWAVRDRLRRAAGLGGQNGR